MSKSSQFKKFNIMKSIGDSINSFFKIIGFKKDEVTESNGQKCYDLLVQKYKLDNVLQKAHDDFIFAKSQFDQIANKNNLVNNKWNAVNDAYVDVLLKSHNDEQIVMTALMPLLTSVITDNDKLLVYNYCANSLGYKREQLPQVPKKNIDLVAASLNEQLGVSLIALKLSDIKPTQGELNDDKIRSMIGSLPSIPERKFIVSGDYYLLDGHHEWGARIELNASALVECYCVAMPMSDLLTWFATNKVDGVEKRDIDGNIQKGINAKDIDKWALEYIQWNENGGYSDKKLEIGVREFLQNYHEGNQDENTVQSLIDTLSKLKNTIQKAVKGDSKKDEVEEQSLPSVSDFEQKLAQASDGHLDAFVNDSEQHEGLRRIAQAEIAKRATQNQHASENDDTQGSGAQTAKAVSALIASHMTDVYEAIKKDTNVTDEYLGQLSPSEFNVGFCDYFAEIIAPMIGGEHETTAKYKKQLKAAGIEKPEDHSFINRDGRFYDFEAKQGVDAIELLPFYKRHTTREFLNYARSNKKASNEK